MKTEQNEVWNDRASFHQFSCYSIRDHRFMWEDDLGMLRRQELAGRDQSVDLFHLDATQLVHVRGGEKADHRMEKGMMLGNWDASLKSIT